MFSMMDFFAWSNANMQLFSRLAQIQMQMLHAASILPSELFSMALGISAERAVQLVEEVQVRKHAAAFPAFGQGET